MKHQIETWQIKTKNKYTNQKKRVQLLIRLETSNKIVLMFRVTDAPVVVSQQGQTHRCEDLGLDSTLQR